MLFTFTAAIPSIDNNVVVLLNIVNCPQELENQLGSALSNIVTLHPTDTIPVSPLPSRQKKTPTEEEKERPPLPPQTSGLAALLAGRRRSFGSMTGLSPDPSPSPNPPPAAISGIAVQGDLAAPPPPPPALPAKLNPHTAASYDPVKPTPTNLSTSLGVVAGGVLRSSSSVVKNFLFLKGSNISSAHFQQTVGPAPVPTASSANAGIGEGGRGIGAAAATAAAPVGGRVRGASTDSELSEENNSKLILNFYTDTADKDKGNDNDNGNDNGNDNDGVVGTGSATGSVDGSVPGVPVADSANTTLPVEAPTSTGTGTPASDPAEPSRE